MTPRDELMVRLEIAQKNCFDRNEFGIAELIQDARVELSRVSRLAQEPLPSPTIWGQIWAVYGKLDAEDCKYVDREWAEMRGYILPTDGTNAVSLRAPEAADAGAVARTRLGYAKPIQHDPCAEIELPSGAPADAARDYASEALTAIEGEVYGSEKSFVLAQYIQAYANACYASPTDAGMRERAAKVAEDWLGVPTPSRIASAIRALLLSVPSSDGKGGA